MYTIFVEIKKKRLILDPDVDKIEFENWTENPNSKNIIRFSLLDSAYCKV